MTRAKEQKFMIDADKEQYIKKVLYSRRKIKILIPVSKSIQAKLCLRISKQKNKKSRGENVKKNI